MLLWPIAAANILFARQRVDKGKADCAAERAGAQLMEKVEQAQHSLLASLYQVTELTLSTSDAERAKVERSSCEVREAMEKYVGLSVAAA
ncbi:MAG TPA: hypothetical protein VM095_07975, partial [Pyrinomonadaceae bacterium]|nr:hypothetical protein [Pyrinomonadaceae bacterium]